MTATDIFEAEFLPLRAKLLEVAAAFDRLDRADGEVDGDPRMMKMREAMTILLQQRAGRAEQIQMIFSRAYDEGWSSKLGLTL